MILRRFSLPKGEYCIAIADFHQIHEVAKPVSCDRAGAAPRARRAGQPAHRTELLVCTGILLLGRFGKRATDL